MRLGIGDSGGRKWDSGFGIRKAGGKRDSGFGREAGFGIGGLEMQSFRELECWKAAREVHRFVVSEMLPRLPKDERYRLGDQMLRSARSVTANIAEGYGRYHYLDNAKFCRNARGSLYETLDHVITAQLEGMVDEAVLRSANEWVDRAGELLNAWYLTGRAREA